MNSTPLTKTEIKIPCEVYSRIVGYLRPIQNFNAGKLQEYQDRVVYKAPQEAK